MVKVRGFNAFVKGFDPCYKIPSRKRLLEGTITAMYNTCQNEIKTALQNVHSVVLTTDMWTSRSTMGYLAVTCHFVDNWEMWECLLESRRVNKQHPGGILAYI